MAICRTQIYLNFGTFVTANGHFDNISADKIKTLGRPKFKRCLRADTEQITLRA
jgi:hypothetical protein